MFSVGFRPKHNFLFRRRKIFKLLYREKPLDPYENKQTFPVTHFNSVFQNLLRSKWARLLYIFDVYIERGARLLHCWVCTDKCGKPEPNFVEFISALNFNKPKFPQRATNRNT